MEIIWAFHPGKPVHHFPKLTDKPILNRRPGQSHLLFLQLLPACHWFCKNGLGYPDPGEGLSKRPKKIEIPIAEKPYPGKNKAYGCENQQPGFNLVFIPF
jgi:hypothetical protein